MTIRERNYTVTKYELTTVETVDVGTLSAEMGFLRATVGKTSEGKEGMWT
jgi:hypothetical protein